MEIQIPNVRKFRPPPIPGRALTRVILIVIAAAFLFTTWFTIDPEEAGVVLRFGRVARQVPSGPHMKLPYPFERVVKVPIERQLKEEFGFRTVEAGIHTTYSEEDLSAESLMLTGDLNVAVVEWTAQFRVRDPYKYLFKVRNIRGTFRDMNETVMREVIGDRSVNEVLTVGRQEIAAEVERRLQALCNQYETGIKVEQIVLQDVNPPDAVKPSFNEVNQAQQEREKLINEARAGYNQIIPRAKGRAQQTIEQAQGLATDRVNRARGDAELFTQVHAAYQRAPEVTRRRMYLETMSEIYPKVKKKIVLDDKLKGVLPLLSLPDAKEVKP
ncbi:MAG TPA: FtsH protease activity modulator HflK [Thermoanaerobaculia bacterium]|jgi:membrane protease subunit HflK|nr:FtsH protease activity modulator HflK [Thermoanaerobaculia bacterium]